MSSWDFTGDQYHVDTESRYPLFSDIQTTDQSLAIPYERRKPPSAPRVRDVRTFESKFQTEQMGIPAYMNRCSDCVLARERARERARIYAREQSQKKENDNANITIDSTFVIVFMFLFMIFIFCFYAKSLMELTAQIESLKRMRDN